MNSYDLGDLVRLAALFEVATVATNPTTTTFRIREPGGTVTTYIYGTNAELVLDSTGNFHVDWTPDEEGVHYVRWVGTGTAQAAAEAQFNVRESLF